METPSGEIIKNVRAHYRKSTVATAIIAVLIFLLLIGVNIILNVKSAERYLAVQLNNLSEVFSSHDFPQYCRTRIFPLFLDLDGKALDVADRSVEDWKNLLDLELNEKNSEFVNGMPNYRTKGPCREIVFPTYADQIFTRTRQDTLSTFDFSLSFAKDGAEDELYVLGRLAGPNQETLPERIRLRLYYSDGTIQPFLFFRNENDELNWDRYELNIQAESDYKVSRPRPPTELLVPSLPERGGMTGLCLVNEMFSISRST